MCCVSESISENGEDGQQDNAGTTPLIDDVPMVNLASFAIFKLFTEWENEGYVVPELRVAHPPQTGSGNDSTNGDGNPQFKPPKAAPIRSELPNNWESIHPSTLLCMVSENFAEFYLEDLKFLNFENHFEKH